MTASVLKQDPTSTKYTKERSLLRQKTTPPPKKPNNNNNKKTENFGDIPIY